MAVLIFIIEWVISFFVIWGLYVVLDKLLEKKASAIMACIISFIIVGFFCFLIAPFVYSFVYPSMIYMPISIFFFGKKLLQIVK